MPTPDSQHKAYAVYLALRGIFLALVLLALGRIFIGLPNSPEGSRYKMGLILLAIPIVAMILSYAGAFMSHWPSLRKYGHVRFLFVWLPFVLIFIPLSVIVPDVLSNALHLGLAGQMLIVSRVMSVGIVLAGLLYLLYVRFSAPQNRS